MKRLHLFILWFLIFCFHSFDLKAQTQRNPIIEFATGTWCQWCPCGDYTIQQLLAQYPNIIPVAYHGPVGQDPFANFPGNEIINLIGFSGYPTAIIDRATGSPGDYTTWASKLESRVNVPATVSIGIQQSFNPATRQLDATFYLTPLENLNGQYKYNVILTEDSLIYNQVNNGACVTGGPNWIHEWVVRAMINGASGETVNTGSTWNTGEMISKTISYNISSEYNSAKCKLIVFVYKQNTPFYSAEIQQAQSWPLISETDLIVISPNGGENWNVGTNHNILWADTLSENVKIELYKSSTYNSTIIESTPSSGTYNWTIPIDQITGNDYKIRISSVINSSLDDFSDQNFTIAPPSITVTEPNGGESWAAGSIHNILWSSISVDSVKIEFSTDNGVNWLDLISSTPSDGNFAWNIPEINSNNCLIRISSTNNPSIYDISDNVFSVYEIILQVTSPNGGENWAIGTVHNITWNSAYVNNVKIEYSTDSGTNWLIIVNSVTSNGNYTWTVPNTASSNCLVKITDVSNSLLNDISDNVFIIYDISIEVISPNGGEVWVTGTNQNITYNTTNITNVKIDYSTNNGINWLNVANSTPASGSYPWIIPNTPSQNCKVRISDVNNPSVQDFSNNIFAIIDFIFLADIQADSIWLDQDYDGLALGIVDGSGSTINSGNITSYNWFVNEEFVSNEISPTIELTTGTNLVKLTVTSNLNLSVRDSMYISVYSAKLLTGGAILSGVSQYGNQFYVTSMNNGVYRIDSTGTILQSYMTGGGIRSSLCISNQTGLMYVGSNDTRLYCFDASLNSFWDKALGGVVDNSPGINYNGDAVYVGANDNNTHLGFLKSLVASNGNPKWTFQADGNILSSPIVMEIVDSNNVVIRTIIYFGTSKGTIYALDDLGSSYSLFWSEPTNPDSEIVSSPAISEEGMIYIGSENGYLYRFNWDGNFQSNWKKYTGGPIISSPVIDENGIVYIASGSGYVYGFEKEFVANSDPVKIFYQNTGINGTPGIGPDGTFLVGCNNGKFLALDKNGTGTSMPIKWFFQASGPILAPTLITDIGLIYIGSTNGDVFIMQDPSINKENLQIAEYEWPTFKGNNQRSKVVRINSVATGVGGQTKVVTEYSLSQNYPNPFNPSTKINYSILQTSLVQLKIYDLLGNELAILVNKEQPQGLYEVNFDANNLASGIYFYRIEAHSKESGKNFTQVRKMLLMK